jgi:hypothetical protein
VSGPQAPSQSVGKLPYRTVSVVKSFPVIGRRIIAGCPRLSKNLREISALPPSVSKPTQAPRLSGEQLILSCVEPCDSHRTE